MLPLLTNTIYTYRCYFLLIGHQYIKLKVTIKLGTSIKIKLNRQADLNMATGNRISSADFLVSFHSNYVSYLA